MREIIEQEIKWCEEHRGMKSAEFEDGFIAGLKQVLAIWVGGFNGFELVFLSDDCGKPYNEFGLDTTLLEDQWLKKEQNEPLQDAL